MLKSQIYKAICLLGVFLVFFLLNPNFVYAEDKACLCLDGCYKFGGTMKIGDSKVQVTEQNCKFANCQLLSSFSACPPPVKGGLGCYCKINESTEVEYVPPISSENECKAASGQSLAGYGTLSGCEWNVSGKETEAPQQKGGEAYKLPEGIEGLNQLGTTDIRQVLGNIIKVVMGIIGSIAFVMFVYAGFIMMTGSTVVGGGATKRDISKAKSILVWSALGVIVILASYALVDFVFEAFR